MNLQDWDFLQNGNVPLDGEWEFYYQQFLYPEDFQKGKFHKSGNIDFPGSWKDFEVDGKKISG